MVVAVIPSIQPICRPLQCQQLDGKQIEKRWWLSSKRSWEKIYPHLQQEQEQQQQQQDISNNFWIESAFVGWAGEAGGWVAPIEEILPRSLPGNPSSTSWWWWTWPKVAKWTFQVYGTSPPGFLPTSSHIYQISYLKKISGQRFWEFFIVSERIHLPLPH